MITKKELFQQCLELRIQRWLQQWYSRTKRASVARMAIEDMEQMWETFLEEGIVKEEVAEAASEDSAKS